jgi:hypothetical protein
LRSSLSNAALNVEDRVVLGAGSFAGAVRRPFQRAAWAVENWLVWPLQEETDLWSRTAKAAVLAGVVVLAGAALAAGIAISSPSGSNQVATLPGPAAAKEVAHSAAAPTGPVLHGTAPSFAPEAGEGAPSSSEPEVLRSEAGGAKAAETAQAEVAGAGAGTASKGPEVAGPAAIKVAREFANAFVFYEVGKTSPKVKAAIAATASPDLTKALLRRPVRLPSNVKVPKAKVLNVVAGPRTGSTYTLSVSLLRVGVTSELRLDMKQVPPSSGEAAASAESGSGEEKKVWQVTDVLG